MNNFRKSEIMSYLLFNDKQNFLIENLDMPDLSNYYKMDQKEVIKSLLDTKDVDLNPVDLKLKQLFSSY